jgi:chaperonin GroES
VLKQSLVIARSLQRSNLVIEIAALISFARNDGPLRKGVGMKLQPLADRIVARTLEAQAKSAAGILLPDSAKEKPVMAEVLAVGKDVSEVKVGDKILYAKYGPTEVKVDGEELMLLKEEDVLAVVK